MKNLLILPFVLLVLNSCGKDNGGPVVYPRLSIQDVSVAEGTGGNKSVEIKLILDKSAPAKGYVKWSTVEGTAKAGADFIAVNGVEVIFEKGQKEHTIQVQIVGDDIKEGDETFQVKLHDAVNINLDRFAATVTIKDDDTKIGYNNAGYDAPTSYPGYTLEWSNEFNNGVLDNSVWSYDTGDGCPELCGWGNNELQYYTNRASNLFFQDGKMIIEARKESLGGKNYTSAKIKTNGKKSFKYGRIDIRAILPTGQGIWPAFWMMPEENVFGTWPRSGELDIMEMVGNEPNTVLGTVHYGPGPGSKYISKTVKLQEGIFNDKFHVYSLEWEEDKISWLVDGEVFGTVTKSDLGQDHYPFNEKFYLMINLAVGGNWPGAPDETTVLPQWLIVDYVRFYQK